VLFVNLFKMNGIEPSQVTHIIISSVVPPVETTLRQVCETCFHVDPLFVEPGIKTGMPVLVDNPSELGADRLADSIAAFERYGGPCIVVNFGTATRFEVVSARGEYLGGAISPASASAPMRFSHMPRASAASTSSAPPKSSAPTPSPPAKRPLLRLHRPRRRHP